MNQPAPSMEPLAQGMMLLLMHQVPMTLTKAYRILGKTFFRLYIGVVLSINRDPHCQEQSLLTIIK